MLKIKPGKNQNIKNYCVFLATLTKLLKQPELFH